ncbi:anaerobic ribonucleoside-triphosphate reductase activating protein [Clostridia bacterium]|nr:anaerobic ribonucleoside-triphosphate reductase activating protein [Clostridia bacterium]
MRIAGIVDDSIVDGEGLRLAIFFQGCEHRCAGCHNPETHDLGGGFEITLDEVKARIDGNPLLDGVTLSGGEPFLQETAAIAVAAYAHSRGLNVWCYTGYTIEQLTNRELLEHIDVLVDGPFILEQRSLELDFRGSLNQRVLRLPRSCPESL